ncbi:MAG: hypothetical protein ACRCT2_13890 [Plesiomonas shigelloides]
MTTFKSFREHPSLRGEPIFSLYWFEGSWVLAGSEGLQRLDRIKLTHDNMGEPFIEFARVNGLMAIALDEVLALGKECNTRLVPFSMDSSLFRVFRKDRIPPISLSLFDLAVRDFLPAGRKSVFLFWNETHFSSCRGAASWNWDAFASVAEAIEAASVVESPEFRKAIAFRMGDRIFSFLSPILAGGEWEYSEEDSDLQDRIAQVLGNRN